MRLAVKASAGASRNAVLGWHDTMLKVAVTAVPEHGKANVAIQKLLATTLRLPKSAVMLKRGDTHSEKLFEISGLDDGEILRRLPAVNP